MRLFNGHIITILEEKKKFYFAYFAVKYTAETVLKIVQYFTKVCQNLVACMGVAGEEPLGHNSCQ